MFLANHLTSIILLISSTDTPPQNPFWDIERQTCKAKADSFSIQIDTTGSECKTIRAQSAVITITVDLSTAKIAKQVKPKQRLSIRILKKSNATTNMWTQFEGKMPTQTDGRSFLYSLRSENDTAFFSGIDSQGVYVKSLGITLLARRLHNGHHIEYQYPATYSYIQVDSLVLTTLRKTTYTEN